MDNYLGIENLRVYIGYDAKKANAFLSTVDGNVVDIKYHDNSILIIYIETMRR